MVPCARAAGCTSPICAPSAEIAAACGASRVRLVIEPRDRSDRGERLAAEAHRRHALEVLQRSDLARRVARERQRSSSRAIPAPSSSTCTRLMPPASSVTVIACAPASTLFSSSSFSTEAGRSTTSPAAIWLTSSSAERGSSREIDLAPPVMRTSSP